MRNLRTHLRRYPRTVFFGVLGESIVEGAQGPIRVGGPKPRSLLTSLVARANQTVPADVLIDVLWFEDPPISAEATLRSYLSRMRRALGRDRLASRQGGYVLRAGDDDIDAHLFDRLIDESELLTARGASAAALDQVDRALGVWRGRPYQDSLNDGLVLAETSRLEERRHRAIELRLSAMLALGRHAEATPELEAAVEAEPYREERWRLLMLALYRSSRQADALAAYRRAASRLGEDLGIEPGVELAGLEEKILLHDPGLLLQPRLSPERVSLPAPGAREATLIGRHEELEWLSREVGSHRLVTVTGPGGTGKTALAMELVGEAEARFENVVIVELATIDDPAHIDQTVVASIAADPNARAELGEDLTAWMASAESVLVVLDNCEHIIEGLASKVEQWLAQSTDARFLVTSREPLALDDERVLRLRALSVPGAGDVNPDTLSGFESVACFTMFARRVDPEFAVVERNSAAVALICRLLDGIPLALQLAAGKLNLVSVEELSTMLEGDASGLSSRSRSLPDRQRTLKRMIEWSYELLNSDEKALFDQLAVFRGSFDVPAIAAICDIPGSALDLVETLVAKSLLLDTGEHPAHRFEMFESTRHFARRRFLGRPDSEQIRSRHCAYFLSLAVEIWERYGREEPGRAINEILVEFPNIRVALEETIEHRPEDALPVLGKISRFWRAAGLAEEGVRWTGSAVQRAENTEAGWPDAACSLGALLVVLGRTDEAEGWLTTAGERAAAASDPMVVGRASNNLGVLALERGDLKGAIREYEKARSSYAEAGHTDGELVVLGNLGSVHSQAKGPAVAMETHLAHLALSRQANNRREEIRALINIGISYFELDDTTAARPYLEEAVAGSAEEGLHDIRAAALQSLAELLAYDQHYQYAEETCLEALQLGLKARFGTVSHSLTTLAEIASGSADDVAAAYLDGLARKFVTDVAPPPRHVQLTREELMTASRQRLGGRYEKIAALASRAGIETIERIATEPKERWLPELPPEFRF